MNRRGFLKLLGMGVVAMTLSGIAVDEPTPVADTGMTITGELHVGDVFTIDGWNQTFVVTSVIENGHTINFRKQA